MRVRISLEKLNKGGDEMTGIYKKIIRSDIYEKGNRQTDS